MTKITPRVYIFHFQDGRTETLIGTTIMDALWRGGHGEWDDAGIDYYEAPADEVRA